MKVRIKHGKKVYADLVIDFSSSPDEFKALLFSLTGVEPQRQKIMLKGGMLKDDWGKFKPKIKEGMQFLMMGTPSGGEVKAPEMRTEFAEDQEEDPDEYMPPGLVNLGNTCYMNATLQCLAAVPELGSELSTFSAAAPAAAEAAPRMVSTLGSLLTRMTTTYETITPGAFWQALKGAYPQFAEMGQHGPAQQDAEECFTQIVTSAQQQLPAGAVDKLFGLRLQETVTCEEPDVDEPAEVKSNRAVKMQCFIDAETAFMLRGLEMALEAQVEKMSPTLGRNALYKARSRLAERLPAYTTVQFVRFTYRQDTQQKAKKLKQVDFPFNLDLHDFCTDELKARLRPKRDSMKEAEDERLGLSEASLKKAKMGGKKLTRAEELKAQQDAERALVGGSAPPAAMDAAAPGAAAEAAAPGAAEAAAAAAEEPAADAEGDAAAGADAMEQEGGAAAAKPPAPEPADELENMSGYYELFAVLTHKGRTADSGHYVGWVKHKGDVWVKFDDDKVSAVGGQSIVKKLSGGGDLDMAYICMYRARKTLEPNDV